MPERFHHDGLEIAVDEEPGRIVATWSGKSSARAPLEFLGPLFDRILESASRNGSSVRFDFCAVQHFNTATVAAIVQLIRSVRDRGLALTLCYDEKLRWQRLSFDALRVFERDTRLEIRGCR